MTSTAKRCAALRARLTTCFVAGSLVLASSGCARDAVVDQTRAAAPASSTPSQDPVDESHLLDEGTVDHSQAAEAEDCTGSGCSDDGEFIGGPTVGEMASQNGGSVGSSSTTQAVMVVVPDLVGLAPADAKLLAEYEGLRLMNGATGSYGVVASQTPRAGTRVREGASVLISVQY